MCSVITMVNKLHQKELHKTVALSFQGAERLMLIQVIVMISLINCSIICEIYTKLKIYKMGITYTRIA